MPWRRAALGLVVAVLAAGPARAGAPVTLRMEGWMGGFKGADIQLIAAEGNGAWQGRFVIRGAGLVKWLTRLEADAQGSGRLDADTAEPRSYVQHVVSNKSERIVELGFAGDPPLGRRVSDREIYVDPARQKRDPENVPDLPEAQRRGTMDPIAAILTLGRRAIAGERHFTLPIYDGRRRFDLAVDLVGPARHGLGGKARPTIDAVAVVHPVAGFKPFHLRWWSGARFDVFLDPKTGLPLQISSSSFYAAVVLTAKPVCPPDPVCALPGGK